MSDNAEEGIARTQAAAAKAGGAALVAARSCPFLEIGGSLEVSELMQMPG
jgi:hypothetical protein